MAEQTSYSLQRGIMIVHVQPASMAQQVRMPLP